MITYLVLRYKIFINYQLVEKIALNRNLIFLKFEDFFVWCLFRINFFQLLVKEVKQVPHHKASP